MCNGERADECRRNNAQCARVRHALIACRKVPSIALRLLQQPQHDWNSSSATLSRKISSSRFRKSAASSATGLDLRPRAGCGCRRGSAAGHGHRILGGGSIRPYTRDAAGKRIMCDQLPEDHDRCSDGCLGGCAGTAVHVAERRLGEASHRPTNHGPLTTPKAFPNRPISVYSSPSASGSGGPPERRSFGEHERLTHLRPEGARHSSVEWRAERFRVGTSRKELCHRCWGISAAVGSVNPAARWLIVLLPAHHVVYVWCLDFTFLIAPNDRGLEGSALPLHVDVPCGAIGAVAAAPKMQGHLSAGRFTALRWIDGAVDIQYAPDRRHGGQPALAAPHVHAGERCRPRCVAQLRLGGEYAACGQYPVSPQCEIEPVQV